MEEFYEQLADVRGEALAARVLSTMALNFLLHFSEDKKDVVEKFTAQIDASLSKATFSGGDADLNERVREIGRMRAHQAIDSIRALQGV